MKVVLVLFCLFIFFLVIGQCASIQGENDPTQDTRRAKQESRRLCIKACSDRKKPRVIAEIDVRMRNGWSPTEAEADALVARVIDECRYECKLTER